jgi:precorrin-4/cobalt-precorrin-4 C11-methyltransferase
MKVCFVGAGPGDPELITLKGKKRLEEAAIVVYAGSLVPPTLLTFCAEDCRVYDSASMSLEEICGVFLREKEREGLIVRLHSGDPSVYGAIQEQMDFLEHSGIPYEIVPGVSSFQAASAALKRQLTLPGISQTVVLTRTAGRTSVPAGEDLSLLARSRSTMVIFLSADRAAEVKHKLLPHYGGETPAAVVYRASWPDEVILRGTLERLPSMLAEAGIKRQALILVGDFLDCEYKRSRLYDGDFSHGYRETSE